MTPKLVHCLFASMLVGSACAGGAVAAGGGLLLGLLAYSLGGSTSLVPIALLAFRATAPARPNHATAALGPLLVPTLH
ncbi:MAG: hypothetical protein U1E34_07130 [Amaricoccus sp.]